MSACCWYSSPLTPWRRCISIDSLDPHFRREAFALIRKILRRCGGHSLESATCVSCLDHQRQQDYTDGHSELIPHCGHSLRRLIRYLYTRRCNEYRKTTTTSFVNALCLLTLLSFSPRPAPGLSYLYQSLPEFEGKEGLLGAFGSLWEPWCAEKSNLSDTTHSYIFRITLHEGVLTWEVQSKSGQGKTFLCAGGRSGEERPSAERGKQEESKQHSG